MGELVRVHAFFDGIPISYSPRSRALMDYYGVTLPEFMCYRVEKLASKLAKCDSDLGLDFMCGHLAQFFSLTMSHDAKVAVVALKVLSDIAGLTVKAGKTEINVAVKLGDLIGEAMNRVRVRA